MYGSENPSELDDPDTISVVVGDSEPPRRRIWVPPVPGSVQQR